MSQLNELELCRDVSRDEAVGIAWWNLLTRQERGVWLAKAKTAVPAEAWAFFKAQHVKQGGQHDSAS